MRDTVKELCIKAKISGFHSNHSLRSTSATKLYQKDVEEQLIQEITGHRSVAIRSYKCTSDCQCKNYKQLVIFILNVIESIFMVMSKIVLKCGFELAFKSSFE